ncbi:MAG: hypothetical protein JXR41_04510 [Bacteroidales bacterium]|nr:hypothetical protein [Bacteroidales bacterium]MBN2762332.1 hypothetical protein [Bacteroidales bacterium]
MKSLDDFFGNNRALFDNEEPPAEHFERFYQKLERSTYFDKTQVMSVIFKIAAVLVFALFLSVALYLNLKKKSLVFQNDDCPNKELCEAEIFYTKKAENYYHLIEQMPFSHDPKTHKEILKELREMDDQVALMKKDLKQNPYDERIVHSIINYYQEKIALMDMIIVRTKISKNSML